MSTPNELAAALMVDHADVVTDAKRARDRVAHIGNMLAQYAATITVEQLTSDAQALLTAGEDIRRYERVAAHLLAAADQLAAGAAPRMDLDNGMHIDASGVAWKLSANYADSTGRIWRWDGRVAPGLSGGTVPIMRSQDEERIAVNLDELTKGGNSLTAADHPDEPGPARTGQDDTGPDRTEAGRMVADTGYPTAPANGPEAGQ